MFKSYIWSESKGKYLAAEKLSEAVLLGLKEIRFMRNRMSKQWRLITVGVLLVVSLVTLWTSNRSSLTSEIHAKEMKRKALQQCELDILPTSTQVSVSPGEEAFGFGVAVEDGCSWQVQSAPSWIRLLGDTSGTGSSAVAFQVDPNNTGAPRSGVIFLNDNRSHVVSQQ